MSGPDQREGGRRSFFRSFLGEVASLGRTAGGVPQCRISDLHTMADARLARIRPVVRPGWRVEVDGAQIRGTGPGGQQPIALFSSEIENTEAFNGFDGETPLEDVARRVALRLDWDEAAAFEHVRVLFLRLCDLGACMPSRPDEQA